MSDLALQPRPMPAAPDRGDAIVPAMPAPALLFRVPDDELEYFWTELDDPEQQRFVNDTFAAIEEIHLARNRIAKAVEISDRHLGRDGFSVKTLLNKRRLYAHGGYKSGVKKPENYVQAGDWKALVPSYWLPENKHHPEFIKWLAKHAGGFQRDQGDAAAIRELKLSIWPEGKVRIPGYGTWRDEFRRRFPHDLAPPDCPPDFFPAGWSDRQLYRLLPEPAHLEIVRHGVAAAEELFAQILNDRTKLYFGQVIIIDDFWAPFKVRHGRDITFVMGLAAIDWASGAWVHHAIMPGDKLPDGTRSSLTAAHMQWFIIGLLRSLGGLPRDRMITLLVENNTASVSNELEEVIKATFQGRVIIRRSGLLNEKQGLVLEHGFRERGGKWRAEGKGLIESGFNLLKNEMCGLPGQRGSKERTNGHAAFPDSERYALALVKNGVLSDEHVAMLKLPFLTYADALVFVRRIFERINSYRQHKCRGFAHVTEWRLSERDQWSLYGDLPTPEQQALLDAGAEIISRTLPESRLMRAKRLRAELEWTKIPEHAFIPLGAEHYKPVTVTEKKLIKVSRTGEDDWDFYSAAAVASGLLVPGKEYRGFVFGEDGASIHLTPKDSLSYLGTVPRFTGVDPLNEEERGRAYAETLAPKRAAMERVREVHAEDNAALGAMRTHNAAVVAAAESGRAMLDGAAQARVTTAAETRARGKRRAKVDREIAEASRATAAATTAPTGGGLYDEESPA